MMDFLKNRWVLLLVLCVFIACKIPHLSYPYYWDESWPYAPAIKAMCNNGISLMPGTIDAELSRGHPLFFHVMAAGWMKVFGGSPIAMHSFALCISVLLLMAVFEIGARLFNQRVAVMALLLIVSQEIFIVQSSAVLLEVLVGLLCILSLYFYVKDKYLLTALCLTALFYTKESGLVMGVVLGIDALAGLFNKNTERKKVIGRLVSVVVPGVFVIVFFLLQKHVRGWYIFPLHSENIEHSWPSFWSKFRLSCVNATFSSNLKYYYFLLLGLIAIIAAFKSRKMRFLAVIVPIAFVYYLVDDKRALRAMPGVPFFTLFTIVWFWAVYLFNHSDVFKTNSQRRFFVLTSCFTFCFLCFTSLNFFSYRYMLPAILPFMIITATLFDAFIANSYKVLSYVSILAFGAISYFAISTNDNYGDTDLGSYDAMKVQQGVINYMEQNNYYEKVIGLSSFVECQHFLDPATGFLKKGKAFKKVDWVMNDSTDVTIFDNIEPDSRRHFVRDDTTYGLAYRIQEGKVWAEVYKRK